MSIYPVYQDQWKQASAKRRNQNAQFLSIPTSKARNPTAKIIFVACRTSTLVRNSPVSQTPKILKRENLHCKSRIIAKSIFLFFEIKEENFFQNLIFRRLDFAPCRNPKECVPMNRQSGVRVNLDMYKPKSCCATLSWNHQIICSQLLYSFFRIILI